MDDRPSPLSLPALGMVVGGVLAGHWLTYLLLRPEQHTRAELLAHTGHGYLATAVEIAWLLALIGAAATFLGQLTKQGGPSLRPSLRTLALRMSGFQLAAFVLLEVSERAVGGSFEGLLAVCLAGAAVQVAVGSATAWFLRRLMHVADAVAGALGRTPALRSDGGLLAIPAGSTWARRPPSFAHAGIRGPPPSLG